MDELYNKAKLAWGITMPREVRQLPIRDDDHVMIALQAVIYNMRSTTWEKDSRIAWRIMQGRL